MRKALTILRYFGSLLIVIGSLGWFAGFIVTGGLLEKILPSNTHEYPLGGLEGIAIDGHNRIYCCLFFYSRIQVYDQQGNFLRGWYIKWAGRGSFRMKVDDRDHIHIATPQNYMYYVYNAEGVLLKEEKVGTYKGFGENKHQCRGIDGNIYTIKKSYLFPKIIKTAPTEQSIEIITTPFHLWFIMGPFPAGLFAIVGLVIVGLTSSILRELHKEEEKKYVEAIDIEQRTTKRLRFSELTNGVEIRINALRNWGFILFLPVVLFFMTKSIIWIFGGFFRPSHPSIKIIQLVLFIVFCFIELLLINVWLWNVFGKEVIRVRANHLSVKRDILGIGRVKLYNINKMSEIHFRDTSNIMQMSPLEMWGISGGNIVFTYNYSTEVFGIGIKLFEFKKIVDKLKNYVPEISFKDISQTRL
jgi:hypothetical protein